MIPHQYLYCVQCSTAMFVVYDLDELFLFLSCVNHCFFEKTWYWYIFCSTLHVAAEKTQSTRILAQHRLNSTQTMLLSSRQGYLFASPGHLSLFLLNQIEPRQASGQLIAIRDSSSFLTARYSSFLVECSVRAHYRIGWPCHLRILVFFAA